MIRRHRKRSHPATERGPTRAVTTRCLLPKEALADIQMIVSEALRIDARQKKIPAVHWRCDHDRPIFFVELRERYVCTWCEMHDGRLILIASQQSNRLRAASALSNDATNIGRVPGFSMDIVESEENEARA